ncbi:putative allantoate permease [Aaosphaeria arxii CBS 175.79]|uniref:Putative allantoate permease n=1 Tax=Aaosphaeria arxii CBS 175.79 TaxID=1450172 RepID=A0A6A5XLL0_9PLEO|nr:putative allantoate permease [Aaosphaeria arxii CBS 175.79]KAF2014042.1 putative allantoate permease [Aaosphaeria arxii CBS 175.79]
MATEPTESKTATVLTEPVKQSTFGSTDPHPENLPPLTKWEKFLEIIWDGGRRTKEERKLVQRLDLHVMSWATFGYFIRLLDSTNINNAYVSGMKEDLNFKGRQYNLLATFFTCGYLVGQIPSQFILTKVRPSVYLPTVELLWTILTFCFAAVPNVKTVFALRFILGMLEAPFAVGVLTLMGSWYTPRELSKRIAIFYSASYAASMFSGYLQAAIYRGMNGTAGLPGWRWLFIFCGIISIWGPLWGYYAVPDNPYTSRARWMRNEELASHRRRMEKIDRRKPVPLSWAKLKKIVTHWPLYAFTFTLICHCVVTQPLNYFPVWLKSLNRFTVYQINLFPTAAQAVGLVTTLLYGWLSDGLSRRWQIMLIPCAFNFIGMVVVVASPNFGATFFGYLINAASWGFWPVCYAWMIEILHEDMEERAIVIGVAQTFGQAFIAWVPLLILDVGKYAPRFKMGFQVMTGVSVGQTLAVGLVWWFVRWETRRKGEAKVENRSSEAEEERDSEVGHLDWRIGGV